MNIVIIGGGAAGWMAAIAISARFPEMQVTIIDPKAIGPIGVGESVTGVVINFVTDPLHELSLGEMFRRCGATYKTGIWYKNWHGPGTEYLSTIDSPSLFFKHNYDNCMEDFYASAVASKVNISELLHYGLLMRNGLTDHFRMADGTVNSEFAFASCHFDALKFAAWLQEVGPRRANLHHVDDVLESFEQDPQTGHVTKIRTCTGHEIAGDFFIDCSGFHRTLFEKAYRPQWKSYADHIRVDSAIPSFVPYADGQQIPNYTMATAMPHGWMWQIPTQSRLGRGYIFSSRYVSDEQAIADFRSTGVDVGESPRILRFSPGRFEKLWIGNVCTIGLAGVFSEPLEASTIHGMYVQIRLLTELFLPFYSTDSAKVMAAQYNQLCTAAYDDYVDFISFHYRTGRSDTEFWSDYQKPSAITSANAARMEKWRYAFPVREDFAPTYTQLAGLTTGLVIWAPMLAGLGFLRTEVADRFVRMSRYPKKIEENMAQYIKIRNRVVTTALTQAEAIDYMRSRQ
ncbi:MAG: hypothetical protein JWL90_3971 [Chthoniobacteraceae bacterium]|nr:hypothetical protein [Chthoniobacteraceae bacterium]